MKTPVKCPKCRGTGRYAMASGIEGVCYRCSGGGSVEGDRATVAARKAERSRRAAAYQIAAEYDRDHRTRSRVGLAALEDRQPERYARAVEAIHTNADHACYHLDHYAQQPEEG